MPSLAFHTKYAKNIIESQGVLTGRATGAKTPAFWRWQTVAGPFGEETDQTVVTGGG